MSLPVLIGFAGVLVAAAATGLLAGRCVRQPRIDLIVWTAATLGLTIALVAQSMGFARGFGPVTFRVVQLSALVLAPLWLAWGLVELVIANEAARFGLRLVSGALTVVASVILATDPLTAQPFGKSWPLTGVALPAGLALRAGRGAGRRGRGRAGEHGPGRGAGRQERSALAVGDDDGRPGRSGRAHDGGAALSLPADCLPAAQPASGGAGMVRGQQGLNAALAGGRGRRRDEMGGETACGMAAAGTVPVTGTMTTTGLMNLRARGRYVPESQVRARWPVPRPTARASGLPGPARPRRNWRHSGRWSRGPLR